MKKSTFLIIKGRTGRVKSVKAFVRGLSWKSILLAITYLYNYITEEKINDLEKLLCLCYLVVLLREVTIII